MIRDFCKKILLCLGTLIFIFILLECVFIIYYFFKDGRYISVKDKLGQEQNQFINTLTKKSYSDTLFPHPYLAFVHSRVASCNIHNYNSIGLFGHEYPFEKKAGTFVILVTGGSVAAQYAGLDVTNNILEWELNNYYTNEKTNKFIVLNGGDGAWAQPQQFILFSLYANIIDGLITLDGFNERYKVSGNDHAFEYPAPNFLLSIYENYGSWKELLFLSIDGKLYRAQQKFFVLRNSKFMYFIILSIRNKIKSYVGGVSHRNRNIDTSELNRMFALPNNWDKIKKADYQINQYKRYIRMMNIIANYMGIKRAFLIQPCPALNKNLTPKESNLVGDLSYRENYRDLNNSLLELRKEGIPVDSLIDIFENYKDEIYVDVIHMNKEGNRIMNKRILSILEREWGFRRKKTGER